VTFPGGVDTSRRRSCRELRCDLIKYDDIGAKLVIIAGVDREIYREIKDGRGGGIDYGSSLGNVRDVDMPDVRLEFFTLFR